MINPNVKFCIDNFIKPDYFEISSTQYVLQELQVTDETMPTCLVVNVTGDNLCLKNYDKKGRALFLS